MNNEAIKERIEELNAEIMSISNEISKLEDSMKGYYIGICASEYETYYIRLGYTTYNDAVIRTKNNACYDEGTYIKEITKEQNKLFYEMEGIIAIKSALEQCEYAYHNHDYNGYKQIEDIINERKTEIEEELDLRFTCSVFMRIEEE